MSHNFNVSLSLGDALTIEGEHVAWDENGFVYIQKWTTNSPRKLETVFFAPATEIQFIRQVD